MSNVIDEVLGNRSNEVVEHLGRKYGLDPSTTSSALTALLPTLAAGLKSEASSAAGAESLKGALASGRHTRYVDDPDTLEQEETTQDGNGILSHIFGSKEVSREVATRASAQSGVSPEILEKLLPIGAAALMGVLAKRQSTTAGTQEAASPGGGLLGALTPLLKSGLGGSGAGDLAGMLGKLGRR